MNYEEYTLNDLDQLRQECDRLAHCQDGGRPPDLCRIEIGQDDPYECYGSFYCTCGCGQLVKCAGGDLCRALIMRMKGHEQTLAVRRWMALGLCICPIVIRNHERFGIAHDRMSDIVATGQMTHEEAIDKMNALGGHFVSDYEYTKASGNWSAARRRKLVRCPCGAYFCNDAARAAGLYSESEWKRMGYPYFRRKGDDVSKYYIDPNTAKRTSYYGWMRMLPDGKVVPYSHVRKGPQPVARIWRAFYEPRTQRWESGIHSVDLFSADQIDLTRFELTAKQALALLNGDKEIAKLVAQHRRPKRKRYKRFDPKEAARQYEEDTGFRKPK
jgi:hypothetical protein